MIKHITKARISCLFSFHLYLLISYRIDTLIITVDMSSKEKKPPSNKKIVQSTDTTDFDGRLALAGNFLFMDHWNNTAAAMQMDRCTKEEQASTVKQRIVHRNRDKLKKKPPPPHSVAIGTSSSIISHLTSSSQSPTKQSELSVASSSTTAEKQKSARVIKRCHTVVNDQHAAADKMRKRKI